MNIRIFGAPIAASLMAATTVVVAGAASPAHAETCRIARYDTSTIASQSAVFYTNT